MVTCCCMDSWIIATPLKTNTALKINGWKMEFPFAMVPFWGTFVHFRGRNMAVLLLWVLVSWLWCISTHLVGRFPGQDPDQDESVQAHHPSRPNCILQFAIGLLSQRGVKLCILFFTPDTDDWWITSKRSDSRGIHLILGFSTRKWIQ